MFDMSYHGCSLIFKSIKQFIREFLFLSKDQASFTSVIIRRASLVFTGLLLCLMAMHSLGLVQSRHQLSRTCTLLSPTWSPFFLICTTAVNFNEDAFVTQYHLLSVSAYASVLCHTILVRRATCFNFFTLSSTTWPRETRSLRTNMMPQTIDSHSWS